MKDGRIKMWSMKPSEKALGCLKSRKNFPVLALTARKNILINSNYDISLCVWDLRTKALLRVLNSQALLYSLKLSSTHLLALSWAPESQIKCICFGINSHYDLEIKDYSPEISSDKSTIPIKERCGIAAIYFQWNRKTGVLKEFGVKVSSRKILGCLKQSHFSIHQFQAKVETTGAWSLRKKELACLNANQQNEIEEPLLNLFSNPLHSIHHTSLKTYYAMSLRISRIINSGVQSEEDFNALFQSEQPSIISKSDRESFYKKMTTGIIINLEHLETTDEQIQNDALT
ncbi:unnamed protein product [Lepeophtheirus salmonis]|uniref:(salmon louse) hypothetical protein n=1 Tax=Lepeophtheirus salmonis TaxID=72036 RepID=A0A7R8CRN0_LEPSM|nr:unnamed protein product [Lepeophtheirus salmonis]CAF2906949.1 unnamed protein product [Lepeophtheirus salmonis]